MAEQNLQRCFGGNVESTIPPDFASILIKSNFLPTFISLSSVDLKIFLKFLFIVLNLFMTVDLQGSVNLVSCSS